MKAYKKWLDDQLEGTMMIITAQEEQTSLFIRRISRIAQVLKIDGLSLANWKECEQKLSKIEENFHEWKENIYLWRMKKRTTSSMSWDSLA